MLKVILTGMDGNAVRVNEQGELQVAQGAYDDAVFNELDIANQGYTFYKPNGKHPFIVTGFLIYGDKQVSSNTNATVVIYEASQENSAVVDRVIVKVEVGQNQSIPFSNVRVLVNAGTYLNAKTDDDDIHMTIFGHYI